MQNKQGSLALTEQTDSEFKTMALGEWIMIINLSILFVAVTLKAYVSRMIMWQKNIVISQRNMVMSTIAQVISVSELEGKLITCNIL